jgi:hypothetical protein
MALHEVLNQILLTFVSFLCCCRYPIDRVPPHTRFKPRQGDGHASVHCHVPYDSGPCLPAEAGSSTATCPMALDPASLLERASVLPHVTRLRIPPSCLGGLRCCHVSHGSRPCLPALEGSGAAMCPTAPNLASLFGRALVLSRAPQLWTPPPCSRGLRRCHMYRDPHRTVCLNNEERLSCNDM